MKKIIPMGKSSNIVERFQANLVPEPSDNFTKFNFKQI